jgi:uncharacterized RDD family membrane protein YckC
VNKSIEITTTQNVTIEYELASLRERAVAWLLDLAILVVSHVIVFFVAIWIFSLFPEGFQDFFVEIFEFFGLEAVLAIYPLVAFFLYHILFEIWNRGQTLGKMAMKIKVARLDGKDPEWSDVVLRALLQVVDSLFSAGVIGALLVKTTGKSQRFGDMAANTTVIKLFGSRFAFRLEDILNIYSIGNYQPTFPQVRSLTERDMIFIKNVLSRCQLYPNEAHNEVVEDLVTHLMPLLGIGQRPSDRVEFLKTLLRDYIVLTR